MTNLTPVLRRIEELVAAEGLELARPARYLARHDCVRVDLAGDWWLEFDADMFQFPESIWEHPVKDEIERLIKKVRKGHG